MAVKLVRKNCRSYGSVCKCCFS